MCFLTWRPLDLHPLREARAAQAVVASQGPPHRDDRLLGPVLDAHDEGARLGAALAQAAVAVLSRAHDHVAKVVAQLELVLVYVHRRMWREGF